MLEMQNDRYKTKYVGETPEWNSWHVLLKTVTRGDLQRKENKMLGTARMQAVGDGGFRRIEFMPVTYGHGKRLRKFSRDVDAGNSSAANMHIITDQLDLQLTGRVKRRVRRGKYGNFGRCQ